MNFKQQILNLQKTNVDSWLIKSANKLTSVEVCKMFDLDIDTDTRNKIFWNININNRVFIDETMLDYIGYKGISYCKKKYALTKLLKHINNRHIKYTEIADTTDPRRKYYMFSSMDFESLMKQMRTPNVMELRSLLSFMNLILAKYHEYERQYELHQTRLLVLQNTNLIKSIEELKTIIIAEQAKAEEERVQARARLEQVREQCTKAEDRSQLVAEKIVQTITLLTNIVASRAAPQLFPTIETRTIGINN